jgi:hypothetical protein
MNPTPQASRSLVNARGPSNMLVVVVGEEAVASNAMCKQEEDVE